MENNLPTLEQFAALRFRLIGGAQYDAEGKIDTRFAIQQTLDDVNTAVGNGAYPDFDPHKLIQTIFERSAIHVYQNPDGQFEIVKND